VAELSSKGTFAGGQAGGADFFLRGGCVFEAAEFIVRRSRRNDVATWIVVGLATRRR